MQDTKCWWNFSAFVLNYLNIVSQHLPILQKKVFQYHNIGFVGGISLAYTDGFQNGLDIFQAKLQNTGNLSIHLQIFQFWTFHKSHRSLKAPNGRAGHFCRSQTLPHQKSVFLRRTFANRIQTTMEKRKFNSRYFRHLLSVTAQFGW